VLALCQIEALLIVSHLGPIFVSFERNRSNLWSVWPEFKD